MSHYECMICGSREHVLREGQIVLCTRCVAALGEALEAKIGREDNTRPKTT